MIRIVFVMLSFHLAIWLYVAVLDNFGAIDIKE